MAKKVMKPMEWVFLILCVLILVYVGLESVGIHLVDRTEETEWVENPTGPEEYTPPREDEELNANIDATLQNIARRFHEDKVQDRRSSKRELQQEGLSPEAARYMEGVQERAEEREGTNWLETIRTSYETYQSVRSLFNTLSGQEEETELPAETVGNLLKNPAVADQIYSSIERNFSIPEEQSRAFAKQGEKALSDWATFVDENKEKQ